MSEKDIKLLMELAEQQLQQPFTEQEALASFVAAGILDAKGHLTRPYAALSIAE